MSYRMEYLTPRGWWTGHKGVELKDPVKYAQKLTADPDRWDARVTDNDTGELLWAPPANPCPYCTEKHAAPHDGSCLL